MLRDYVDVQVLAPGFHDPDQNRQEDAITPFGRAFTAQVNGPVVIHCAVTSGVALVIDESFASAPPRPRGQVWSFSRAENDQTWPLDHGG